MLYYNKLSQKMDLILGRLQKLYVVKKTDNKQVWLLNNVNSGQKYVGKFQPKTKLDKVNVKHVLHEASFLQMMQGHTGIPAMYWSGMEGIQIVLILQHLGYTLEQRLSQCGGKFSLKTTCMLGISIINIIRNLHEKGLVHRNLSPTSLQFGRGLKSLDLYINDMIDCKKFRNKKSYAHISQKKGIKYAFQNSFASTRFHKNEETSRVDDLENIIKVLIYFTTGVKPNYKGQFPASLTIPVFLKQMLNQCLSQDFASDPNYQWQIQKLKSTMFHNSLQEDGIYDWMTDKNRAKRLRVSKHIVNLNFDEDKQILAQFYDPYEQSIDIDEVTSKHHKLYGQNNSKVAQNPVDNKKGYDLEQKLRKRKSTHKQKPDCCIM